MSAFTTLNLMLAIMVLAFSGALLYERRRLVRNELELRSAQRAARDGESNLRQLRDEVVRLERLSMIGELSTAVAHELNQPLAAILSNAQAGRRMLEPKSSNSEVYQILADIIADGKRAALLIERLRSMLAVSESGRSVIELATVVREVLAFAHSDLIARNVNVSAQLSSAVPPVLAHRVQIQQVLLNLILNASDAMADDVACEPRLLTVGVSMAEDGFVLVRVADTGSPILAAAYEKLFTRSVSTSNRVGLGLAVSKSIVDAHGGRMWAISNSPAGATICFTLPPWRGEKGADSGATER